MNVECLVDNALVSVAGFLGLGVLFPMVLKLLCLPQVVRRHKPTLSELLRNLFLGFLFDFFVGEPVAAACLVPYNLLLELLEWVLWWEFNQLALDIDFSFMIIFCVVSAVAVTLELVRLQSILELHSMFLVLDSVTKVLVCSLLQSLGVFIDLLLSSLNFPSFFSDVSFFFSQLFLGLVENCGLH